MFTISHHVHINNEGAERKGDKTFGKTLSSESSEMGTTSAFCNSISQINLLR